MDKAKGGMFEGGRYGWVGWGVVLGLKTETTVLEQQFKKKEKRGSGTSGMTLNITTSES